MSKYTKKSHSSYWMSDWDDDSTIIDDMSGVERKAHDYYKLSAAKRAIANFVNIVTNKSIPVKFNNKGESYTNGQAVVIGSNISEPADFDIAVGLALHEGSHIKLSDFELLKRLDTLIPEKLKNDAIAKGLLNPISTIKDIWNYVEDRRIDWYVFNQAPGYREYYRAMYDKYFNDPLIDKALLSDEYTDESIESYMFRLINLHNQNTSLGKLNGLRKIYSIIDLANISRLKSTLDTLDIALLVFAEIINQLPPAKESKDAENNQSGESGESGETGDSSESDENGETGQGDSNESDSETADDSETNESNGTSEIGDSDADDNSTGGSSMSGNPQSTAGKKSKSKGTSQTPELTDKQKGLLKKKIEKQKDFLDGNIQKKTVTKSDANKLNAIEESGSEVTVVGTDVVSSWGRVQNGIECIVVKKLTKSLMDSSVFPLSSRDWSTGEFKDLYRSEVETGIRLGTIIGKKLQIRGENRDTVFNRQKTGRIDKRMISSLGFGNENVFQYMETDSYKKANLHVSLDASGSMNGQKWRQTLTNVTALCKAVDMIPNLSIQVSIRTTSYDKPYVIMAYDSKVDKFSKVKSLFPGLYPGGTTPEGLCYDAIMKNFISASNDVDSYFLNISDGDPYFLGYKFEYYGQPAYLHTQKMVRKIESMGIKTLSYFMDENSTGRLSAAFKTMYGAGARAIDVTNTSEIVKTMNSLFLSK